jgi:regulatory protein
MTNKKAEKLTPNQALEKLKHYCAYQDRCHTEVKDKLFGYGLLPTEADATISILIEEDYLNEERFALQFAGGKFRMRQWGRIKIKYALKGKQVSDYCIKKALASIPDDAYHATLLQEFEKKNNSLKSEKNIFIKKRKLKDFLQQRGFELEYINELLKKM